MVFNNSSSNSFNNNNIVISLPQINTNNRPLSHVATSSQVEFPLLHNTQNNIQIGVISKKLTSTFNTKKVNRNINKYTNIITKNYLTLLNKIFPFYDNISKQERQAIKSLKLLIDSKEIVICITDKSSGLVIVSYSKLQHIHKKRNRLHKNRIKCI